MPEKRKSVTPQDVIPDGDDAAEFQGVQVRKGTVKAVIENANALKGMTPGTPEYEATVAQLHELRPALVALGVFDVLKVKDPVIAAIIEN